jgi:hypothetical protein
MPNTVEQQRLSFGKRPVVLVGDPRRCVGVFEIHNPADAPVKLRRLRLRSGGKLSNSCDPEVIDVLVLARLCACETRKIEVSITFPPSTPPGTYEASLVGAEGASCPVSIHMLELRRLRLSPSTVSYSSVPGGTVKTCVTASNLGNVPITIPPKAPLVFRDRVHGWHHHFHAAVSTVGDQGNQPFLDEFLKRMAASEPPVGRAKILRGAGELAPNESRVIEVEICIPNKLHAPRNYHGFVTLGDATLAVNLHLSPPEPDEPPVIT